MADILEKLRQRMAAGITYVDVSGKVKSGGLSSAGRVSEKTGAPEDMRSRILRKYRERLQAKRTADKAETGGAYGPDMGGADNGHAAEVAPPMRRSLAEVMRSPEGEAMRAKQPFGMPRMETGGEKLFRLAREMAEEQVPELFDPPTGPRATPRVGEQMGQGVPGRAPKHVTAGIRATPEPTTPTSAAPVKAESGEPGEDELYKLAYEMGDGAEHGPRARKSVDQLIQETLRSPGQAERLHHYMMTTPGGALAGYLAYRLGEVNEKWDDPDAMQACIFDLKALIADMSAEISELEHILTSTTQPPPEEISPREGLAPRAEATERPQPRPEPRPTPLPDAIAAPQPGQTAAPSPSPMAGPSRQHLPEAENAEEKRAAVVRRNELRKEFDTAEAALRTVEAQYAYALMPEAQRNRQLAFDAKSQAERLAIWFGDNVYAGVTGFNRAWASTVDFFWPDLVTPEIAQKGLNTYRDIDAKQSARASDTNAMMGGGGWNIAGYGVQATVGALPHLLAALASCGASEAASLLSTTGTTGAGLVQTIKTAAQTAMKDPRLWTSFTQIAGPTYDQAKADGATEIEAMLTALLNGFGGAAIEMSGGFGAMPRNQHALRIWIKTMLDEGHEEVLQGMLEQLLAKTVYDSGRPVFSTEDPSAVVNPARMAAEFGGGAFAGGMLSGGKMGLGMAMDAMGARMDAARMDAAIADAQARLDAEAASEDAAALDTEPTEDISALHALAEQMAAEEMGGDNDADGSPATEDLGGAAVSPEITAGRETEAQDGAAEEHSQESASPEGDSSQVLSLEDVVKEASRMSTPATLREGGAQVTINEIADVTEPGEAIVTLADGSRISIDSLEFSNKKLITVYQAGGIYGKEGAARFVENYDDSVKPTVYAARFKQFYDAALRGIPFENIRQVSDARRGLSLAAQKAAYAAGEAQRGSNTKPEKMPMPGAIPPGNLIKVQPTLVSASFNQSVPPSYMLPSEMGAGQQASGEEIAQTNEQSGDDYNHDVLGDSKTEQAEVSELQNAWDLDTIIQGGVSGALNASSKRAEKHAVQYYEAVRHMKSDINRISKNTGWRYEHIEKIKNYVFFEKHELFGCIERFDPSYDMAQSWQRLIQGTNIKEQDIVLLNHEYLEMTLVEKGYTQSEAHSIASEKHNYRQYVGGE